MLFLPTFSPTHDLDFITLFFDVYNNVCMSAASKHFWDRFVKNIPKEDALCKMP